MKKIFAKTYICTFWRFPINECNVNNGRVYILQYMDKIKNVYILFSTI